MTFPSLHDDEHFCFVTASIVGWKHLFATPIYRQVVLDSLIWLRKEKRISLYVFVIMSSHLHLILKPIDRKIGQVLKDFGGFTAHAILKELKRENQAELLRFFHENRRDSRHKHSIWQDIQAKNIFTQDVFLQKMECIHQNPLVANLVEDRADYLYSSASFYDREEMPTIEIDDARNVLYW